MKSTGAYTSACTRANCRSGNSLHERDILFSTDIERISGWLKCPEVGEPMHKSVGNTASRKLTAPATLSAYSCWWSLWSPQFMQIVSNQIGKLSLDNTVQKTTIALLRTLLSVHEMGLMKCKLQKFRSVKLEFQQNPLWRGPMSYMGKIPFMALCEQDFTEDRHGWKAEVPLKRLGKSSVGNFNEACLAARVVRWGAGARALTHTQRTACHGLWVSLSGDIQVYAWMRRCGNTLLLSDRLSDVQKSRRLVVAVVTTVLQWIGQ
jgi:hypothetical protein